MLIMGAANTYSNIMGSGEPVFLEAPWLAWCLSALVPIGSVAFKYVSNFFDHASSKKRYAIFIFILTTFAIIAWAVMFAQNFNGIAGGMDWDSLGSSDGGKGSLMVFLQIAAEILISAALFLAIEDISIKYNPDILKNNPDHTEFSAALKKHKAEHEATGKKRNTDHTAFVLLKNQRQQHLNMRSTEFAALILSRPL